MVRISSVLEDLLGLNSEAVLCHKADVTSVVVSDDLAVELEEDIVFLISLRSFVHCSPKVREGISFTLIQQLVMVDDHHRSATAEEAVVLKNIVGILEHQVVHQHKFRILNLIVELISVEAWHFMTVMPFLQLPHPSLVVRIILLKILVMAVD